METDFQQIKVIDQNNSTIVLYQNTSTLEFFVKKYVPITKSDTNEKEFQILNMLNHPNIIKVYAHGQEKYCEKDCAFLQTEYVENKDLITCFLEKLSSKILIIKRNSPMYEKLWRSIFIQIVDAIYYLNIDHNISHGDIKPDNLLIKDNYVIRLADFENAIIHTENPPMCNEKWGTPNYYAPEIRDRNVSSYNAFKADIFSLGATFLNLLVRADCFSEKVKTLLHFDAMNLVKQNKLKLIWTSNKIFDGFSIEFQDLIEKMLCYEPENRIDISEVRDSEWMKKDIFNLGELKKLLG